MAERAPVGHKPGPLPRSVIALGVVSLLTDIGSDMAMPFLPVFLVTYLHAGAGSLGLIEGVAESTAALTKYFAGRASDRAAHKKPLVLWGYGVTSLVRPLLALVTAPWQVLAVRFVDRVGKGVRTAPRDAIIARDTTPADRGYAFGFHRSMDNLGAVIGPLLASGILLLFPHKLRLVFACTAVPGLAAVLAVVLGVRDAPVPTDVPVRPRPTAVSSSPMSPLGRSFAVYLSLVGLFTLADASDTFLILRARDLGTPEAALPLAWGALSLLRTLAATPGGRFADRVGRARALSLGWALYAVAYVGFGLARTPLVAIVSLLVYGLYYGLTEGAGRALVASFAEAHSLGRAYGVYNLVTGVLALPSSLIFGLLYRGGHGTLAFVSAAISAGVASIGMGLWSRRAHTRAL